MANTRLSTLRRIVGLLWYRQAAACWRLNADAVSHQWLRHEEFRLAAAVAAAAAAMHCRRLLNDDAVAALDRLSLCTQLIISLLACRLVFTAAVVILYAPPSHTNTSFNSGREVHWRTIFIMRNLRLQSCKSTGWELKQISQASLTHVLLCIPLQRSRRIRTSGRHGTRKMAC